ncbi:MAG: nitronate monooxygenase family protein [Candidatus Kapabacteria bacterium]|jgi:nitronate monooxygenase|nr:nitronate monooxygenase family protein [Candidatus Kapabacteria bacterium]
MKGLHIGDLFVKVPVIQGGMGVGISLYGLASAVANQGGVGVISAVGIGMTEPDYLKNLQKANLTALRKQIQKARSLTDGVLGVNIMLAVTDCDELIRVSIEEEIDIIFIGAGLPLKIPAQIGLDKMKTMKTKIVPKLSSGKAVALVARYWDAKYNMVPPAFVIEGPKAGGHLGFSPEDLKAENIQLEDLIEEAVEAVKPYEEKYGIEIPIIAAGGIYDGHDMREIFKSGAKAVKMGTRFVTTYECDADIEFKNSYLACEKDDIEIVVSPVGMPGRVIRNKFVDEIKAGEQKPYKCSWRCIKTCDYKKVQYCIARVLFNAADGKMDQGFSFAGSNAYKADRIQSVKEVFDELKYEFEAKELEAATV